MADQKLNIIFTGDVSQLNKAMQSVESELTKFEQKLKESLGVEGFAAINQQVEQLKQKLASLQSIDIKANPQQALSVIKEVQTGINSLKSSDILLKIDDGKVLQQIQNIDSLLSSLTPNIDTSEFQRKLAQITSGVSEINLKADTSEIDSSIKAIREKLSSINITANPDDAFAALREISTELNKIKSSQVFINLNDDKAIGQIHDLDKLLDDLTATIRIDADVKSQIDKIKSQLSGFKIDINADSSNADSIIKNLQSKLSLLQDEKFIISADGQQAEAIINEIFSDLKNLKDTKVLINADGTPALSALENIQNKLQESLQGKVTIDTNELQQKLESIKSLSGELIIESDFSQVENSIKSIREKLSFFKTIDINADPQQALTAINEILTEISKIKSNEILLKSDNTDVLFDINQIQTRLQEVKTNINITANLDTKNLEALLKPLSTQVSVSVSTKAAEAEIKALLNQVKALKGQDILINLDGTQVVKTIDAIERELLQLQAKLKTATNPADIAKLTQQLQLFKNSLSATNANQFSSSMNRAQNASFAFSQVLREAPAFAFSFQTGLLGISNNLPILADRFKEARAAGLSTSKIFGEMAKSLVSLPGIMTIVSTAAIFIAGALNKSGKEAGEAAREIKKAGEIIGNAFDNTAGDVAQVQALVRAFGDTSSFEKQKRILSELKGINDSYFGELKAGVSTYEDITKAAEGYTQALVQEAIVKGLKDEITELSKQLRAASKEYRRLQEAADFANEQLEKTKNIKAIGPGANPVGVAANVAELAAARLTKAGKVVDNFKRQFNELIFEVQDAIGIQLRFKSLDKVDDDIKDESDKIIARARAFVKQFGEVFVTPDLEESFTNTKDKILTSAKKLIDDISKGNLQIKIPVQVITEADFLPVQVDFKDTKKEIEELTKGFFEGVKLEKQSLKVEVVPEFSIPKDLTKQFDDLQQQFIKLGERGKKAFIEISFGAKDGTNQLQAFNDGLKKAEEELKKLLSQPDRKLNFEVAVEFAQRDTGKEDAAGNKILEDLSNSAKEAALTINETLTPAFQNMFDAIIEGKNPLKAFFDSIVQSINKVIQKLIQAAVQAAILSAITGGTSGGFGNIFLKMLGVGNTANPFSAISGGNLFNSGSGFIGGVGGSQAAQLTARISGTDLLFVLNQGQNIVGRNG